MVVYYYWERLYKNRAITLLGKSINTRCMARITPLEGVMIIRQKFMIWNKIMQRMDFSRPGPMISV